MRVIPPVPLDVEFNGLPGPTHNYAGLSFGNVASATHRNAPSSPLAAALQTLDLAEALLARGVPQALLPPQRRPRLDVLRALGHRLEAPGGLERALASAPLSLLASVFSASSMWTANAATVAPATDTRDGRTHLVVANLVDRFHRSLEPEATEATLRAIFQDDARFCVHAALPSHRLFGDEGAANHTRLTSERTGRALHLFVYGADTEAARAGASPTRFPARQSQLASERVRALLTLRDDVDAVFWQQHPDAIDAGVFHNDVICVGHGNLLLLHEAAFADPEALFDRLRETVPDLVPVVVSTSDLPLADAVGSYLFNSRLVTDAAGRTLLVAPAECRRVASASRVLDRLAATGVVDEVVVVDLHESMRNGGGPACLRLRVPLAPEHHASVAARAMLDAARIDRLRAIVRAHYRERVVTADLRDPAFVDEARAALDAISAELGYPIA